MAGSKHSNPEMSEDTAGGLLGVKAIELLSPTGGWGSVLHVQTPKGHSGTLVHVSFPLFPPPYSNPLGGEKQGEEAQPPLPAFSVLGTSGHSDEDGPDSGAMGWHMVSSSWR